MQIQRQVYCELKTCNDFNFSEDTKVEQTSTDRKSFMEHFKQKSSSQFGKDFET